MSRSRLALIVLVAAPLSHVPILVRLAADEPERRVIRLHYTAKDRATGRYQYVPFEVAEGTTRIDLEYRYDRAGGSNAIDLGLFEPGALELGASSFRGWSGGARSRISVGVGNASPGYWPGPLPAGEWRVLLGLYKVAPAGVDVEVVVEARRDPEGPAPTLPPWPKGPLRSGPGWYLGALHVHTVHSDGTVSPPEVARMARAEGLDFLTFTEHNNTAYQLEAFDDDGLLRIAGEEVTTPGGHANVWGLGGWRDYVEFRVLPGDPRFEALVKGVADRGALFSINHPRIECQGCSWEHTIPPGVQAVEVWNGVAGPQEAALTLWDSLLLEGRRITGVGASDWHRVGTPIGSPSVRVWASELSQPAILEGIRQGRVIIVADGTAPPPEVAVRAGKQVARVGETLTLKAGQEARVDVEVALPGGRADLYWNGARTASAPLAEGRARFERKVEEGGHLRVQVHRQDGSAFAITNPVWLTLSSGR